MSINNMKIRTRLGLGFATVLALLIAVLLLGLNSMGRIGNHTRDIVADKNVKMAAANVMANQVRDIILSVTTLVATTSDGEVQAQVKKIAEARKRYAVAQALLDDAAAGSKQKALMEVVNSTLKAGAAMNNRVIELRTGGDAAAAMDYLNREAAPSLQALIKALDAIVAYEDQMAREAGAEAQAVYGQAQLLMLTLGALALLTGAFVAWYISHSITVPVNHALALAETVAAGDLSSRIPPGAPDETGRLLVALKSMNDNLLNVVSQVRSGTDTIAVSSHQITAGNLDLSSRTEKQAAALQETASSMEQLIGTVKQNADNARQANQLAHSASEVARQGGALVSQVVDTMTSINTSSHRINDIIGVIDGIAFQTNILALNAAVEAARAGEQGRGFAVVATEVRNLAQRSAAAAREIKELIATSVSNVDAGSKLVNDAGQTMGHIVDSIQRVTDIMGEISSASQEQASGIEQVNIAIGQMDQATQENAALVEQAAAASQSMQEQVVSLTALVGFFNTGAIAAPRPTAGAAATTAALPPRPAARAKAAPRLSVVKPAKPPVTAGADSDWETF